MNLDWIFAGAQTQQVMPTVRYNKIGIIENEMAKSDISVQDFPTGDKPNYLEENLLLEIHSLDLVLFPGKLAMPSRLCLNRAG